MWLWTPASKSHHIALHDTWLELWYYLLLSHGGIDESTLKTPFYVKKEKEKKERMCLTIIYLFMTFVSFGHNKILRALASGSNSSFDLSGEKRIWALPYKESQKYHLYQKAHKYHFLNFEEEWKPEIG